jgi:hypothetical protein
MNTKVRRSGESEHFTTEAQQPGAYVTAGLEMKVRLTRKFAELIDGIDLSHAKQGDTLDLSARDALTLIAEGWAAPVPSSHRAVAHERPRRSASRRNKKAKKEKKK